MKYVICPETITSPAPDPEFFAKFPELRPNEPCGVMVPIVREGEVMACRCSRGHQFFATRGEIREAK